MDSPYIGDCKTFMQLLILRAGNQIVVKAAKKQTKKNIKMETKIALETKTRELGTFKPLRE